MQVKMDYIGYLLSEGPVDVQMYHGSDKYMRRLDPFSINMGTSVSQPRWSIFLWRNRDIAISWAIYSLVRSTFREKKSIGWNKKTHDYLYNPQTGGTLIDERSKQDWLNAIEDKDVYLYNLEVPLIEIGIGHTKDIDEYTLDRPSEYRSVEKIKVTKDFILETIQFCSEAKIMEMKRRMAQGKIRPSLLRRIFGPLMLDDYFDDFNTLSRGLALGEIRPGDSIHDYLNR
jgi:hypothetical protein